MFKLNFYLKTKKEIDFLENENLSYSQRLDSLNDNILPPFICLIFALFVFVVDIILWKEKNIPFWAGLFLAIGLLFLIIAIKNSILINKHEREKGEIEHKLKKNSALLEKKTESLPFNLE